MENLIHYDFKRSGFNDTYDSNPKYILGLVLYLTVFGLLVPYILIKNKMYSIMEGYMPNLDLIACVLGYSQGPFEIFKYLYNPSTRTINGIISSLIINYTALLGVTYIIAHYTFKLNDVFKGWSRAIIMLLMTYLIPGYFLAYLTYYIGKAIDPFYETGTIENWCLVVSLGLVVVATIIAVESAIIHKTSIHIATIIKYFSQTILQS